MAAVEGGGDASGVAAVADSGLPLDLLCFEAYDAWDAAEVFKSSMSVMSVMSSALWFGSSGAIE